MEGFEADVTFYDLELELGRFGVVRSFFKILKSRKWDMVYMEGTGISAGLPLIFQAAVAGQRFIVSSGDPIGGFFYVTKGPLIGRLFSFYERQLYRSCSAFIGWTPYLCGAAIHLGARRAITVEGGVDLDLFKPSSREDRESIRQNYGLPEGALVCGMVGSLVWNTRQSYSYGLELVEALKRTTRTDIFALIVGDGTGRKNLESRVPASIRSRIIFTGKLAESDVVKAIGAMDIGFITQTMDSLGLFRLTTKLPEYLACGLPVAMSPIPGYFDYVDCAGWGLPALHPADPAFHAQCATWLDGLQSSEINEKRNSARQLAESLFGYKDLGSKFRRFLRLLLDTQ